MRKELRALARLAEIDDSAKELDEELRQIPARIDEMRGDVTRLSQLLERERAQLAEAESLRAAQQAETASRNEMLSRAKAKSAQARNAREAEAADREVEAIRRTMKERDEERERLNQAIEGVRSSLAQHESEFEELRRMCAEEEATAKVRMAELEAERGKVVHGRDEVVASLPRDLAARYERIRKSRGTGVAEARDGTCQACRMQLPPQTFIELQRCTAIEQCATCHRILIVKQAIED